MQMIDMYQTSSIPEGFTPRVFTMDPEKHELLYGSELENGMVVLLEDSLAKANPKNRPEDGSTDTDQWTDFDEKNYMENNRWCVVTSLRHRNEIIQFIALYSDGTQASRRYNESFCWYAMTDVERILD